MRWLMIALLVSLAGLLLAALGMARHIWIERAQQRHRPGPHAEIDGETAEETEPELEHGIKPR